MTTRRDFLRAIPAASLVAGASAIAAPSGRAAVRREAPSSGRAFAVEMAVKATADLNTSRSSPWWYEILIYAMRPDKAPLLMVAAEGCEHIFARREADGSYRFRNSTVSSFKDATTGEWLDRFANPLTGLTNVVTSNVIEGGSTIFAANGRDIYRDNSDMKASQISGAGSGRSAPERVGQLRWIESGDRICLIKEGIGQGAYQPLMEVGSMWMDRSSLLNRRITRLPVEFASSFVSPWMPWMGMGRTPGHLLWHSSGRKLDSLVQLPDRFRRRAEQVAPGRLAQDAFA